MLPIYESMDDIQSIFYYLLGKEPSKTAKIAKLRESTADLWVEPPKWRTEVTHWVNQHGRNIETQMIINVDLMNYRSFFWKVFFQMPKCWFIQKGLSFCVLFFRTNSIDLVLAAIATPFLRCAWLGAWEPLTVRLTTRINYRCRWLNDNWKTWGNVYRMM